MTPLDCSPPGPSVHGILQVRILEWIAIPFSRGSFWPRDQTLLSCTASRFFIIWATGKFFLLRGCGNNDGGTVNILSMKEQVTHQLLGNTKSYRRPTRRVMIRSLPCSLIWPLIEMFAVIVCVCVCMRGGERERERDGVGIWKVWHCGDSFLYRAWVFWRRLSLNCRQENEGETRWAGKWSGKWWELYELTYEGNFPRMEDVLPWKLIYI